ncbi:MAG: iron-containing alcohol dehydrogenase [Coriobacteriia bacterium]|nr:iron-containing alcohol dehydrogenase [Coriobacteriia bacterium]
MIPAYFEFSNRAKLLAGEHAIEQIPYELGVMEVRRPILVTNRQLRELGLADIVSVALADGGTPAVAVFAEVPVDSSVSVVNDLARAYRESGCDGIVAVGGGSVLDTAKGASLVLTIGGDDLMDRRGAGIVNARAMVPLVAVPTTAGTGSEVTGVAVIKDAVRDVKMAFVSPQLVPDVAVLDPRMTVGLPPRLTASTAMDALCHAVEAFTSRQANPLSDAYARAAVELIRDHLPLALSNGRDASHRHALATAAALAGASFSNAMVGIVHAIGHACGGHAGAPHGEAMGILLPWCMEFNLPVTSERYGELLLHLAGPDEYARTPTEARPSASIAAVRRLLSDARGAGMPTRLSEVGITVKMLPAIAQAALDDGSMSTTPRDADLNQILGILEAAL